MNRSEALKYRRHIEAAAALQTDEAALQSIELYKAWKAGIDVTAGERYRDKGVLYRCNQSHRTQDDWAPEYTTALWTRVTVEAWPDWVQPAGAHDAYSKGAHVAHGGRHWESAIDNNTWEPGVYGWDLVTE